LRFGNLFTVRLPIDQVWGALLDIQRIAPCVPGARLVEVADGEYRGVMRVQVGTAAAEYDGWLRVTEVDEAARRIAVHAIGAETRDGSQAAASVTASLAPAGGATSVTVDTELSVRGRLGQFGAGVMTDVAASLFKEFARRLEQAPHPVAAPTPPPMVTPTAAPTIASASPPVGSASSRPATGSWLPAGLVAVLAVMAVVPRRRWRWALAALGAGLVAAGQRRSSST